MKPGKSQPGPPADEFKYDKTGFVFETPKNLAMAWIKRAKGREYEVFVARMKRELAGEPIPREEDDYYVRRKRLAAKAAAARASQTPESKPDIRGSGKKHKNRRVVTPEVKTERGRVMLSPFDGNQPAPTRVDPKTNYTPWAAVNSGFDKRLKFTKKPQPVVPAEPDPKTPSSSSAGKRSKSGASQYASMETMVTEPLFFSSSEAPLPVKTEFTGAHTPYSDSNHLDDMFDERDPETVPHTGHSLATLINAINSPLTGQPVEYFDEPNPTYESPSAPPVVEAPNTVPPTLNSRGKYQQPKRIRMIEDDGDAAVAARLAKIAAAKKASAADKSMDTPLANANNPVVGLPDRPNGPSDRFNGSSDWNIGPSDWNNASSGWSNGPNTPVKPPPRGPAADRADPTGGWTSNTAGLPRLPDKRSSLPGRPPETASPSQIFPSLAAVDARNVQPVSFRSNGAGSSKPWKPTGSNNVPLSAPVVSSSYQPRSSAAAGPDSRSTARPPLSVQTDQADTAEPPKSNSAPGTIPSAPGFSSAYRPRASLPASMGDVQTPPASAQSGSRYATSAPRTGHPLPPPTTVYEPSRDPRRRGQVRPAPALPAQPPAASILPPKPAFSTAGPQSASAGDTLPPFGEPEDDDVLSLDFDGPSGDASHKETWEPSNPEAQGAYFVDLQPARNFSGQGHRGVGEIPAWSQARQSTNHGAFQGDFQGDAGVDILSLDLGGVTDDGWPISGLGDAPDDGWQNSGSEARAVDSSLTQSTERTPDRLQPTVPSPPMPLRMTFLLDGTGDGKLRATTIRVAPLRNSLMWQVLDPVNQDKQKRSVLLEQLDPEQFEWQLQNGSVVQQWAKIIPPTHPKQAPDWRMLMATLAGPRKLYAAYTEAPKKSSPHFALVIAQASNMKLDSTEFSQWQEEEGGATLFLVSLPLNSATPNPLPNPITASWTTAAEPSASVSTLTMSTGEVSATYGVNEDLLQTWARRIVSVLSPLNRPYDILQIELWTRLIKNKCVLGENKDIPDVVLIANSNVDYRWRIAPSKITRSLRRQTKFYTYGPSLRLPPCFWGMRPVWQTGGLVTFSPMFILQCPDKFDQAMEMIRTSPNWAAYIVPSALEYMERTWAIDERISEPLLAYETLIRSLFIDKDLVGMSAQASTSYGGLGVTTAPPSYMSPEKCEEWTLWRYKVEEQKELPALLEACRGVRAGQFAEASTEEDIKPDVEKPSLGTIEVEQIQDLVAMRLAPYVVPYKRYLYVGHTITRPKYRQRYAHLFEYVGEDGFAAAMKADE